MTASDHLKHRTGSLGGDQIPEDLNPYYGAKGDLVDNLIERIAKAEASLAQKTREYEAIRKANGEFGAQAVSDAQRIGDLSDALDQMMTDRDYYKREAYAYAERLTELRAQVEQLGRQVAEMMPLLTNCRNGLELILGEHKPASEDPFDTINELRETVRKSTEALKALASRARTK